MAKNSDRIRKIKLQILDLENQKEDIDKEIRRLERLAIDSCEHEWERYYEYEESGYHCNICGGHRRRL